MGGCIRRSHLKVFLSAHPQVETAELGTNPAEASMELPRLSKDQREQRSLENLTDKNGRRKGVFKMIPCISKGVFQVL